MGLAEDIFCGPLCLARMCGVFTSIGKLIISTNSGQEFKAHSCFCAVLILGGLVTMITSLVSGLCLVVGVYMFVSGIFVGVMEAPLLFSCFEWTQKVSPALKNVQPLHRSMIYTR